MADELPPVVTRLTGDIQGLADSLLKGKALVQAWKQEVSSEFNGGRAVGEKFGKDLGEGIQDAIPEGFDDNAGERLGRELAAKAKKAIEDAKPELETSGEKLGAGLGDGLSKGVEPGLDDLDTKVKDKAKKTGQDAGKAAGDGMSPMLIGAMAAAGSIGGPLLLAGLGGAMVGATALVLKQNQVIAADFQKVGKDAGTMVSEAAAPLTGELHAALSQMDQQVTGLKPEFKSLFADAAPDISAVTTGLTGFAGSVLPGVAQATKNSQVIVSDFSRSLPQLGSDVGGFFTGLVHDANVQGQALNQTIGALGTTVRTAGSLIGSASAAASADLLALTPVLDGLDTAIQKVSSPATVGGVIGLFGALKLDPKIQSGLSSAADGLAKVAEKGATSGGILGKVAGAADGASGLLGKMAGVVGGPWGLAIGAGIGLASGLAAALMNADDATKAITVDQQTLSEAVAKDGATAGEATSSYIAAQAQLSGLADEAKNANVPLDLLTQAAIGNKQAMQELSTAVSYSNRQQREQQMNTEEALSGYTTLNGTIATGNDLLTQSMVISNTLTDADQQLINSIKAQAQQTADAINKQTQLNAAQMALNESTNIFNATLDSEYQKLQAKAQATGQNAVAALNLGTNQTALNMSLADAVSKYDLAKSAASGYGTVLQALAGGYGALEASEAQTDSNLQSLIKNQQQLGHSFTVGKDAGDSNIQMMNTYAQSILASAQAIVQQDVQTGKSSQATQDLTKYINQQRDAFVAQETKILGSKDAAQKLFDEYIDIKNIGSINIPISADTQQAIKMANGAVRYIDSLTGTITVQAQDGSGVSYNPKRGGGKASYDWGGWTKAAPGQAEEAVVHGGEYVLSRDMLAGRQRIDPQVLAALRSAMAGVGVTSGGGPGGGFAGAAGAPPSGAITVIAPVYLDGQLVGRGVTRGTRAEAQNFQRRNGFTGFVTNGR